MGKEKKGLILPHFFLNIDASFRIRLCNLNKP
jgi:hypothetical protein